MNARLASGVLVSGLMRRAESEGGFAAIIAKGDASAGAIVVILAERGQKRGLLERVLQADGRYLWQDTSGQAIDNAEQFEALLERRRKSDPDLWIVELDIPSPERFAAEMNSSN